VCGSIWRCVAVLLLCVSTTLVCKVHKMPRGNEGGYLDALQDVVRKVSTGLGSLFVVNRDGRRRWSSSTLRRQMPHCLLSLGTRAMFVAPNDPNPGALARHCHASSGGVCLHLPGHIPRKLQRSTRPPRPHQGHIFVFTQPLCTMTCSSGTPACQAEVKPCPLNLAICRAADGCSDTIADIEAGPSLAGL
jgi:hypothetical protein